MTLTRFTAREILSMELVEVIGQDAETALRQEHAKRLDVPGRPMRYWVPDRAPRMSGRPPATRLSFDGNQARQVMAEEVERFLTTRRLHGWTPNR